MAALRGREGERPGPRHEALDGAPTSGAEQCGAAFTPVSTASASGTFTDEELYTLPHLEQELLGNNDEKIMLCVVAKSGENVLGAALCKAARQSEHLA